jgi:hypothetical protein
MIPATPRLIHAANAASGRDGARHMIDIPR